MPNVASVEELRRAQLRVKADVDAINAKFAALTSAVDQILATDLSECAVDVDPAGALARVAVMDTPLRNMELPASFVNGVKLTYYTQHLRALASARTSMGRAITNRERALRAAAAADAERAERAAAMAEYERQVADRQEALRRGEAVPPVPVPEHMGERMRPGAN